MANTPEVEIHADLEALSEAAAQVFLAAARRAAAGGSVFCVALSGGSTPRRLYQMLGAPPLLDQVPWWATHVFWGDERAVPPDAPESNYAMARETLLRADRVPADQIHRMEADADDREAAAARYEEALRSIACTPARAPFCLDLVLLGMGEEGHTASLFPGSPALQERDRLVVPSEGAPPVAHRMTLTLGALNASRERMVLVSGDAKASILAQVLTAEPDPDRLPATGLARGEGRLLWMADRAAAADLPAELPGVRVTRAD